ncbi:MAG: glycosyltransferase family 4 protein [Planctomycetes bacterium]|nr:glycosyltransferase family 4 protein [Planctomycetota bacterium]
MKLLFLNTSGAWGGQEMFSGELFVKLREKDVDVRFVLRPGFPLEKFLRAAGHGDRLLETAPKRRYFDRGLDRLLRAEYRAGRVDLVHTFVSAEISYATLAARFMGRARPGFVHHLQMLPGHRRKDLFHRLAYAPLDRVVTITQQIGDRVRELWPVRPERVWPLYYGLDLAYLEVDEARVAAARERWKLPTTGRCIGLVGQICTIKGQLEVFRAFRALADEHPDLSLVIAGTPVGDEPAYYDALLAEIESAQLSQRVVLTGFCDDVPALLRHFDVFALGSYHEPFGRVVIESMAAGCTTIGTRAGGVPEIIDDGVDGMLYEARDVAGLTDALRRALSMTESERAAMQAAAREKVATRFGMDRFMREMLATYREVLEERRA